MEAGFLDKKRGHHGLKENSVLHPWCSSLFGNQLKGMLSNLYNWSCACLCFFAIRRHEMVTCATIAADEWTDAFSFARNLPHFSLTTLRVRAMRAGSSRDADNRLFAPAGIYWNLTHHCCSHRHSPFLESGDS